MCSAPVLVIRIQESFIKSQMTDEDDSKQPKDLLYLWVRGCFSDEVTVMAQR